MEDMKISIFVLHDIHQVITEAFNIGIDVCEHCGGKVKVIAASDQRPLIIKKF